MADVELTKMAHNAIGEQRKEENMLKAAKNPFAGLVQVDSTTSQTPSADSEASTESHQDTQSSEPEATTTSSASVETDPLLTGIQANSPESQALARQRTIEAAAEKREQENSIASHSASTSHDEPNPAGEVAEQQHFEDSSLKTAINDIETDQALNKAEYVEPVKVQTHEDEPDMLGGNDEQ